MTRLSNCFIISLSENARTDKHMKKLSFIFIILAGILWGTSTLFVHWMAPMGFSSLQMTFVRALVTFLAMAVYVFIKDRGLFKLRLKELLLFICSGISYFGTGCCYYLSMQMTSASTAVVLMYTAPILVMIYSVIFLGEKLTPGKLVSVMGMILGCFFVSGIIGGIKYDFWGILIGLLSGISYSAYNIFTKIQMRNGSNPIKAVLYSFLAATVLSAPVSEPLAMGSIVNGEPLAILLMAGLGICTCVLPYFMYTVALKHLSAGTASAMGIIEPMAATVLSVVFLDERLTIPALCGIILILASVYLLGRSEAE